MATIQTKAYFDSDIKPKIIELLQTAKQEVFVASAWFNDKELYDALVALPRTVKAKVLIKKDDERNTLDWMNLGDCGIKVYQLPQENEGRSLMHHKFCVIDNHTVITGSYNWTNGANYSNFENVVVVEGDTKLNFQFKEKFKTLIQPIIEFFENKKELLTKNTDNHITEVRAKTEAHIEEVRAAEKWMLDYMEKYNEMPPEQLTNQQFSKKYGDTSASDIGKGIVVKENANTLKKVTKPKISNDFIDIYNNKWRREDWWNRLDDTLKKVFNSTIFKKNTIEKPDDDGIKNILYLRKLDCSGNNLKTLKGIDELVNLEELNISNNELTSLNGIEKLNKLKELTYSRKFNLIPFEQSRLSDLGFKFSRWGGSTDSTTWKRQLN